MNCQKVLNYSNLFEVSPQKFESRLTYHPNGEREAFSLILPELFSLIALEQIEILTSSSGFGELSVQTSRASDSKKERRVQIQSGISRQHFLSLKAIRPIEAWRSDVAYDWLQQQCPKRHFIASRDNE